MGPEGWLRGGLGDRTGNPRAKEPLLAKAPQELGAGFSLLLPTGPLKQIHGISWSAGRNNPQGDALLVGNTCTQVQ